MLVDDHPLWRRTLRTVIEHERWAEVVAEADNGEQAVAEALRVRPDVVIMDIGLPKLGGIEATRRMLAEQPGIRVLALSSTDEEATVIEAVRAGAAGYLLKTAGPAEVTEAVRRIASGEVVFPPKLGDVVLAELRKAGPPAVMKPVMVGVVSDSVLGQQGLAGVIAAAGMTVAGTWRAGGDLRAGLLGGTVDVIVADLGREQVQPVLDEIRKVSDAPGVLIVTDAVDPAAAGELLGSGRAAGWLLRARVSDVSSLAEAIRRVASGETVVDSEVAGRLATSPSPRSPLADLTDRERSVLALMAEGRSNQAIRQRLFMSARTVESHVAAIFVKLGLEPAPDDQRRVLAVLAYLESS